MARPLTHITALIEHRGLRFGWLVARTGIEKSLLSRVLAGRRPLTPERAQRIADALDIPLQWVLMPAPGPGSDSAHDPEPMEAGV